MKIKCFSKRKLNVRKIQIFTNLQPFNLLTSSKIWKLLHFGKIPKKIGQNLATTSPFRDRVAELRGPSEGLGGGCALLGCTAASRASVEQPIGTSRSSRSKRELVQFEMIQSDWFSILILDDHADLFFVNATTHQSTSSGERVVRR